MKDLVDRACMLAKAREFFSERNVIEVDCPLMAKAACIDLHIDLFKVESNLYKTHYLPSSPEYFMKRLLASGSGDIYQLAHVFRDEKCSPIHNPEFMMAEWYRVRFSFQEMIDETLEFISLFIEKQEPTEISYRDALKKFANIDYVKASDEELFSCLKTHGITPYKGILEEGKDALLNLILGTIVEPKFKEIGLLVLKHYPASQAALAKIDDELLAAQRFEVYYQGLELANGYHELSDAKEQRRRLEEANALRDEKLPIDEAFLKALEKGLPDCCGVAVGFDRLMMIRHKAKTISKVIPFDWQEA